MKRFVLSAAIASAVTGGALQMARADDAPGKVLFDPSAPDAAAQLSANGSSGPDITYKIDGNALDITVQPHSKSSYPGVVIKPPTPWDAGAFGHATTGITNAGTKPIRVSLRLDNAGPWQDNRYSAEVITIKPNQTVPLNVIFGYQFTAKAYALDPKAIVEATLFMGKTADAPAHFKIGPITAGGKPGEKPYVNPHNLRGMPENGVMIGKGATYARAVSAADLNAIDADNLAKHITAKGGKVAADDATGGLNVELAKGQNVTVSPAVGMWNLNRALEVKVTVKNTGSAPLTLAALLTSMSIRADAMVNTATINSGPIAPGATADIIIPFTAVKPWEGDQSPKITDLNYHGVFNGQPGTGTDFRSNVTTGLQIDNTSDAAATFDIISAVAQLPEHPTIPDWLGQRPPVPGAWTKTFEDNFDGNTIDLHKWNIYTVDEWHLGAATHYSKDNVIVQDGHLILRVDKKFGHHDDNPKYPANNYATGYADTFGKWTQRYGYFEARMKLPTAPNMFLAFWTMPDRGIETKGIKHRSFTDSGGMEFDILETESIWGPYRHDFGYHWDNYDDKKSHKAIGNFSAYSQPDKDGFITVGMLWEPGKVSIYDHGQLTGTWETSRVGSVPEYLILDMVTGGWDVEPMDEHQLPADFVFDYVRAWQRKDWASAADGPKPNDGGPLPPLPPTTAPATK